MKRLFRSKTDRLIAGVCGGLGKYFSLDPVIIRALFTLLAFMGGIGVALYIVLAIITPEEGEFGTEEVPREEPDQPTIVEGPPIGPRNKRRLFALFIFGLGVLMLLDTLLPFAWLNWRLIGPGILICLGGYLFLAKK